VSVLTLIANEIAPCLVVLINHGNVAAWIMSCLRHWSIDFYLLVYVCSGIGSSWDCSSVDFVPVWHLEPGGLCPGWLV